MDAGRFQEARRLMGSLASETVVSVSNIPLATYPAAIKEAAKLIDQNKSSEAKGVLQTALNTQVLTETIIPLPVVKAQTSLKEAARGQLELAQALGYGKKSDFETFFQQLKEIEEKTAGKKFGTGFFANIEASITALVKSSQPKKP
jgi:YfdX protein